MKSYIVFLIVVVLAFAFCVARLVGVERECDDAGFMSAVWRTDGGAVRVVCEGFDEGGHFKSRALTEVRAQETDGGRE